MASEPVPPVVEESTLPSPPVLITGSEGTTQVTSPSVLVIENDTVAQSSVTPAVVVQPNVYRAHRDLVYDNLTEKNVEDYGFKFDSDVFVYNENKTQLTSVILNRSLFVTSESFKEYEGDERQLTGACVKKLDDWLRLWGKIPGFLEVRAVPHKGFGIFSKHRILRGVFIGYYDGIRIPFPQINPQNQYCFTYRHADGEEPGSIDGQNLTFSNCIVLINDGHPSRYNIGFLKHNCQMLAVTSRDIEPGEELVGPYGPQYWNVPGKKRLD